MSPNVTRLPGHSRRRGALPSESERLAEISSVLLASADMDLRFIFLNGEWERVLGWLPEELAGRSASDLMHPDERQQLIGAFGEARATGRALMQFECRVATRDGRWRWVEWKVRHEQGRWYGAGQDITERRERDEQLAVSRERLAEAQRIAGLGSFELDTATGNMWISDNYYELLGVQPGSFAPTFDSISLFIHPDDRERTLETSRRRTRGQGLRDPLEFRIVRGDGEVRVLQSFAGAVRDEAGNVIRTLGTVQDVTRQRDAERRLAESEGQLRALVEQVPAIVYTAGVGINAPWDYVSPQIESLLGYSQAEWSGAHELWWDAVHPADRERVIADERRIARPGGRLRSEYRLRRRDGDWVWVRDEATVIEGPDGTLRFQGVLLDVTERKRAEAAVRSGHARLQAIIDNSPLVIWARDRAGNYLFVNQEHEAAGFVTEEAHLASDQQVFESGEPLELEDVADVHGRRHAYLIQKFPLRDDDGEIYGVCGMATDITEHREREEQLRSKVEWSFRIRAALDQDRLVLHRQPIVRLSDGEVVQEEILLRMLDEDGSLIMPADFLIQAERFDMAPAIDRWVIARAAEIARDCRVEVNLSARSIGDPSLPDFVEACLADAQADPGNVVFEITETAAAQDIDQAGRLAKRLAWLGCGFALDDFGTGFGSFTYLKHLPVSYIKIDVDFVRGLSADPFDRQVISAIVGVARNFGIETIAEGVESEATADLLRELGVDYAQGFLFGRPGPL